MKRYNLILLLAPLCLASCFKDEAPNAEADIEHVAVSIGDPLKTFFQLSDTAQTVPYSDSTIIFRVRSHADITALAPTLRLTEGATVSPASGTVHDFSKGAVVYTTTSEDGLWHRTYKMQFVPTTITLRDSLGFGFEDYSLEPSEQKYYVFHADETVGDWATGNPGFKLSMGTAKPDEYPTYPMANGHTGSCAALTTRSTGPFGEMANKRIAAGNLFLGTFDQKVALTNTLHATRFGVPFTMRPVAFKGWYSYQPGKTYQDVFGNAVVGKADHGSIYAVLYLNHDAQGNEIVLYGDNVKTSQQVVAIADLGDVGQTNSWQPFEAQFLYRQEVDQETLQNRGYSLAIVFSSSNEGDKFEGAVGSTLLIDDVSIISQKQE